MLLRGLVLPAAFVAVTLGTATATRTPGIRGDLTDVIDRLGRYVSTFGERASLLVCVEDYYQTYRPADLGEPAARHLVSEFAIVKTLDETGWIGFRDVVDVDGRSVADHRDRLERLFRAGTPDVDQARAIVNESARLNIGPITRTLNVPTVALFFFLPRNLARFKFTRKEDDVLDGRAVWQVAFRERGRPTLIRRVNGRDLRSRGRIWVVPDDGTVVRTRLVVEGFTGSASIAEITVDYRRDPHIGMWVPSKMIERYEAMVRGQSGRVQIGRADATATYSDYRQFETFVRIKAR